jgi:hypothetical protein
MSNKRVTLMPEQEPGTQVGAVRPQVRYPFCETVSVTAGGTAAMKARRLYV